MMSLETMCRIEEGSRLAASRKQRAGHVKEGDKRQAKVSKHFEQLDAAAQVGLAFKKFHFQQVQNISPWSISRSFRVEELLCCGMAAHPASAGCCPPTHNVES